MGFLSLCLAFPRRSFGFLLCFFFYGCVAWRHSLQDFPLRVGFSLSLEWPQPARVLIADPSQFIPFTNVPGAIGLTPVLDC